MNCARFLGVKSHALVEVVHTSSSNDVPVAFIYHMYIPCLPESRVSCHPSPINWLLLIAYVC